MSSCRAPLARAGPQARTSLRTPREDTNRTTKRTKQCQGFWLNPLIFFFFFFVFLNTAPRGKATAGARGEDGNPAICPRQALDVSRARVNPRPFPCNMANDRVFL